MRIGRDLVLRARIHSGLVAFASERAPPTDRRSCRHGAPPPMLHAVAPRLIYLLSSSPPAASASVTVMMAQLAAPDVFRKVYAQLDLSLKFLPCSPIEPYELVSEWL
jgi:hypothetical protein